MVLSGTNIDLELMNIGLIKICDSIPANIVKNISNCCITMMSKYLKEHWEYFEWKNIINKIWEYIY
jgi:hypothetical protein